MSENPINLISILFHDKIVIPRLREGFEWRKPWESPEVGL